MIVGSFSKVSVHFPPWRGSICDPIDMYQHWLHRRIKNITCSTDYPSPLPSVDPSHPAQCLHKGQSCIVCAYQRYTKVKLNYRHLFTCMGTYQRATWCITRCHWSKFWRNKTSTVTHILEPFTGGKRGPRLLLLFNL